MQLISIIFLQELDEASLHLLIKGPVDIKKLSTISLSADSLRTPGLEILGGAAGLSPEAIGEGAQQVYDWIKASKLHMEIEQVPLKDIESVWKRADFQGKRIVVIP